MPKRPYFRKSITEPEKAPRPPSILVGKYFIRRDATGWHGVVREVLPYDRCMLELYASAQSVAGVLKLATVTEDYDFFETEEAWLRAGDLRRPANGPTGAELVPWHPHADDAHRLAALEDVDE